MADRLKAVFIPPAEGSTIATLRAIGERPDYVPQDNTVDISRARGFGFSQLASPTVVELPIFPQDRNTIQFGTPIILGPYGDPSNS